MYQSELLVYITKIPVIVVGILIQLGNIHSYSIVL